MRFYRKLYVSAGVADPALTKWRLRHHSVRLSLYVLRLTEDRGSVEILHNLFLERRPEKPVYIIGLAASKTDAVRLYADIVKEALEHTGSPDVVRYLFPHGIRE
ncbi:hypothetical protein [Lachnoclostridium sp. Marseille-P6806]|uniref:hypothetical protein n=1 Tax=Lachnoclostridium sp. Marseille-P6806 TaxID=2364793 RepID=UPI00103250CA|nr:hypothetical protein [Lachnoclostridium sp. Marseille-P6806]